jgi:hypothetical protein
VKEGEEEEEEMGKKVEKGKRKRGEGGEVEEDERNKVEKWERTRERG